MRNTLRHLFLVALLFPAAAMSQIRKEYRPLADLLSTRPEREPTEGNLVELLPSSPEQFLLLQDDIMAAKKSIHMEFFIFDADFAGNVIRTALRLKALDGVEVQFIAEDFTTRADFVDRMKKSGVSVKHHPFLPLRPRNHQKYVLVDGTVGYTGGMNVARDYFCDWDDMVVRLRGPVVEKMEKALAKMWARRHGKPSAYETKVAEPYEGGVIVQSVDEDPKEKDHLSLKAYIWALEHARHYFYAKTPYFKPPKEFADALADAALRGVDVRIVIPEHKDSPAVVVVPFERVYFDNLVKAGAHILMRTDQFDHAKLMVVDDYLSAVGSINLDVLSMVSNYESNLFFYDCGVAAQVKQFIVDDLENCYEVTPEMIADYPAWQRNFKWFFRGLGKVF